MLFFIAPANISSGAGPEDFGFANFGKNFESASLAKIFGRFVVALKFELGKKKPAHLHMWSRNGTNSMRAGHRMALEKFSLVIFSCIFWDSWQKLV